MPIGYAMSSGITGLLPIPTLGLVAWYNGRNLALSDNSPISTWNDLSGNGRHLTATGTARPTYKASLGPLGLPGATFDGSANIMTAVSPDITNAAIIAFAGAIRAPNISSVLEISPGPGGNQGLLLGGNGTTKYLWRARPNLDFDDANGVTVVTDNVWRRVICVLTGSGGTVQFFLNGVSDASTAYTQDDIYTQTLLSVGDGPTGTASKLDIGELIIYSRYEAGLVSFLDDHLKAWTG